MDKRFSFRNAMRIFFKNNMEDGKSPFAIARSLGSTFFKYLINGFVKDRLKVIMKKKRAIIVDYLYQIFSKPDPTEDALFHNFDLKL